MLELPCLRDEIRPIQDNIYLYFCSERYKEIPFQIEKQWIFVNSTCPKYVKFIKEISNPEKQELLYFLHQILVQAAERAHIGDTWICVARATSSLLQEIYRYLFNDSIIGDFAWTKDKNNFDPYWDTLLESKTGSSCVICLKNHQVTACNSLIPQPRPLCPKPGRQYNGFRLYHTISSKEYGKVESRESKTITDWMLLYDRVISAEQILIYKEGKEQLDSHLKELGQPIPEEAWSNLSLDISYNEPLQLFYRSKKIVYFEVDSLAICRCDTSCNGRCDKPKCHCIDDCGISCPNRSMQYQCNEDRCSLASCSNRNISLIPLNIWVIPFKRETDICLKAARHITCNQAIVQYTGVCSVASSSYPQRFDVS